MPYMAIDDMKTEELYQLFGFKKIYKFNDGIQIEDMTYKNYIGKLIVNNQEVGTELVFYWSVFFFECLNCLIIAFIILQSEIFRSVGFNKYVTQNDGSMDLLIQLSELKAKSITYVYNNYKIRKILSIQRNRETIL